VKKNFLSFNFTLLTLLFSLFSLFSLSAQTQRDWWYTLERGKLMFRQGDYGSALLAFEDARRQRRAMYERMERNLIDLLSLREVRRIGDSLDVVEKYIYDKRYAEAANALEELYYRIPKASLNDSASAALTALGTLKDYPEAEYWIGETYLIEGELNLAQTQFQKALAMRQTLENPGFATDLLYKVAAICRIRQDYNEMERTLLSVLSADRLWVGSGQQEAAEGSSVPFEKQSMTRTLENSGINRFLTLYRYRSTETIDAHRLLGFYYYASGRHGRAEEHLMFAFLIQNTVIIEEVIRNRYDFTFTNLETLAPEINRYPLLAEYVDKNEYYKIAYYLGASLYGNGKASTARELWTFLSTQDTAGEWQVRAQSQLRNPQVEQLVEMP